MTEFNTNEIIASFLSTKINEIADIAKKTLKKFNNELNVKLQNKYSQYLVNVATRYGKTRTFFIRNTPKPLYNFYEPIGLKNESINIEKAYINKIIKINTRIVILGSGGAGKSILLKHLLLDTLRENYKIPVFIELRDRNYSNGNIFDLIKRTLVNFDLTTDDDYLIRAFEEGHFIIFLDGLDEVKGSFRGNLIRQIEEFSKLYNKCAYIISTRPDDKINELEVFTYLKTVPLTLEQSVSLVSKLPAENEIKEKFITDLKSGLFKQHNSFLSNPLLLSIMLLTYGYSADIPNKLSIFYNQAYEALFQRHDALKGAYKRDRESKLDIISFERVLTAFCIITYDSRKFQFSRVEALNYIDKATKLTGINVDRNLFLNDLMQAVCFLIQDGLFITFTHRSFQEYFTAKYISSTNDNEIKKKLLEKFSSDIGRDSIYKLVYELDTTFFETKVIIPFLESVFKLIGLDKNVNEENYLKFNILLYKTLEVGRDGKGLVAVINDTKSFRMTRLIINEVPNLNKITRINKLRYEDFENQLFKSDKEVKSQKISISFARLETTDSNFETLYYGGSYYSSERLEYLLKIYQFLKRKHESMNSDLLELLNEKK